MKEWKEYKLGDIATFSQGIQVDLDKQFDDNSSNRVRFIRIVDFTKDDEPIRYIERPNERYITKAGDVVMIRYGSQTAGQVVKSFDGAIANNTFKITFEERTLSKDFGFYFLSQEMIFNRLRSSQSSSTMPAITFEMVRKLDILVPPLKTQKAIVAILKSLDDKIEVNRRINDNLEQQAQALFKSWFVDFEPFKDGEFVESELGMIPKGWRVGHYEDIIESTISGDWGKEKPIGNYKHRVACIRGCDFQDIKNGLRGKTPERYILENNFKNKHFKDKDVLVEISGGTQTVSTGRACLVSQMLIDKFNQDIVCTNFCRVIRPIQNFSAYLYYSWLYKYDGKIMFGYENGTSGIKNFRIKDFISMEPVLIPDLSVAKRFQSLINNIQLQVQIRGSESSRLAELRDSLLPRLMSGELKVNDVETII